MLIIAHQDGLFEYSSNGVRKLISSKEIPLLDGDRYFFDY
jgi:hypothetical protein